MAELLLGHLLHDEHRAAAAAELCPELLGDAAPLWEKWVREFAACDAVADLAPYIPVASPQLAAAAAAALPPQPPPPPRARARARARAREGES